MPDSRTRSVCPSAILPSTGDASSCRQLRASVSAKHLDTGLFGNFGLGLTLRRPRRRHAGAIGHAGVDDSELFLSGQFGIERPYPAAWENDALRRLLPLRGGASTLLLVGPGDALNPTGLGDWAVWHSDVAIWGGGIAQGIDGAAMILYLTYKHVGGDLELRQLEGGAATGPIADAPIDDLDLLLAGAVIRF